MKLIQTIRKSNVAGRDTTSTRKLDTSCTHDNVLAHAFVCCGSWVEEGRLMPCRYGPILKEYERHLARSINQQREITDSEESLHQDDGPRLQIKTSAKGFEKGRERQNEYRQKEFLSHFPWARSVHESQGYGSRPEIVQHRNFLRLAARFVIAADFSSKSNRQFISREVPTAYILNILTRKQLYEERDLIVMQGNLNFLYYCGWLVERGKGNSSQQTLDKLGLSIDRQGYPPMHQIGKAFPTPRSMRHWVAKSRSVMGQLRGDSFLNSTFSLIPGAEPPIPPKPMDAPSFLLGPMESTPLINPFPVIGQSSQRLSAALLMEWLLSRRGSARANAERKLIKTLLCNIRVASKAQRKIQVTSLASRGYSYACFSTLALYADIMINSFSFRKVLVGSDQGETSALQKRLKAVYLCIDTEIIKGFLKPFARIHAIHGQLRFSYELPVAALHLLREGFNDTDRRTPFDLIRLTLEYMEANNALTDDIYDRGSKAYVPALDLAFFSSAKSFTAAFKADPIDPLYLAWHLAASSACLLLCSGNLIDSFPRCYPSEKIRLDENSDSEASTDCFPHEVREQLDKFEDLRKDVAMSFDMLYELCKQQKSCVSHLCVSSFLEWKQVVALVFGSKLTEDLGSSFVRLHSFHTTQWALQDNSSYARSYLARTQIRDEFIEHLASTLENDPESIDHWRKLVRHLGPISKNSPENAAKRNENIQSDSFLSTKHPASTEETDWKSSRTYWIDSLLTSCVPRTLPFDKESDFRMHRNVARFLEDEEVEQNLVEQQSSHGQVPCLHQDSWFDILCPQNDNSESDDDSDSDDDCDESLQDGRPSKDERLRIHDQILPRAVAEILSQPETLRKPPFSRLHLEDDEEGERIEILCYKAFLLCHFGKKEHPAVSQISQLLIEACWNADRNSVIRSRAEWRAIVWLHRKGVPITHPFPKEMPPLHVPKSPQRAQKGPRKNSTLYPKAMCDAVKEGIRLFGFKQWVLIQATYPIFDGHHRRKAEKCYHFMVKTGLMDPHEEDDGKWRRWKKT